MDRMTPLDAVFLEAEDEEPGVSLSISSTAVFEGPAPAYAEFADMLAGRLPLIPRYRQKVRQMPFDLAAPVWVDDENFDLHYHLRQTALPAPGGDTELATLIGRIMSARLDRDRPLWEYWLVDGLADGRWALISKIHHCMVDGVAGTELYQVVLDPSRHVRRAVPDDWKPRPAPSTVALTAGAVRDLAMTVAGQVGLLAGALLHPATFVGQVWNMARGLGALSAALVPSHGSSLSGPVSAHRRFSFARAAVADVKVVRHELGGTFNDVVLTAVTAGFRALLLSRGEAPHAHAVRTLIPVNVRAPGEEGIVDNRVSLMLAYLPVDVDEPVARLAAVRGQLDKLKSSKEAESVVALTALARREPFPLMSPPYRLIARLPQRSIVTVATNVPGPRQTLYALGRPLVELIPYVPIASTVRIGVSIFSYCDRITFGVTGDYDSANDIDVLARGIAAGLAELVVRATSTEHTPTG